MCNSNKYQFGKKNPVNMAVDFQGANKYIIFRCIHTVQVSKTKKCHFDAEYQGEIIFELLSFTGEIF